MSREVVKKVLLLSVLFLLLIFTTIVSAPPLIWVPPSPANFTFQTAEAIFINYTSNNTPQDSNLRLWITGDNDQKIFDYSPLNQTLTNNLASVGYSPFCKDYGCLDGSASNACLRAPASTSYGTNVTGWTITFWMKGPTGKINSPADTGNDTVVKYNSAGNNKEFILRIMNATGKMRVVYSVDGAATTNCDGIRAVNTSNWIRVALGYNGTRLSLWLNGTSDANCSTTSIFNGTSPVEIFGCAESAVRYAGLIDDFKYYTGKWTRADFVSDYANVTSTRYSRYSSFINFNNSIVGWWPLNNQTNGDTLSSAIDLSAYGRNGTVLNGTWQTAEKFNSSLFFNGRNTTLMLTNSTDYSVSTTGKLTVAFFVNVSTYTFAGLDGGIGYVNFLDKYCVQAYNTSCNCKGSNQCAEWEFRMYNETGFDGVNRSRRMSFYVFNDTGGLGTGSFVQDRNNLNQQICIVGIANGTHTLIYKNGILQDKDCYDNGPTCDHYIVPTHTLAPVEVGGDHDVGASQNFTGGINNLVISNKAWSSREVEMYCDTHLSAETLGVNYTGLINGTYVAELNIINDTGVINRTTRTFFVDSEPPNPVTTLAPSDGSSQSNATLTFTCNASDAISGLNYTMLFVNSAGWFPVKLNNTPYNNIAWTSTYSLPASGTYIFACAANDTLGNMAFSATNSTMTYLPDNTAPYWLSIYPDDNAIINGTANFTIQAFDDVGFGNWTLYGNWSGTFAANFTNTTPINNGTNNSILVTGLPDGIYLWSALVTDSSANTNYTFDINRTLIVDRTAPSVNLSFSIANNTNYSFYSVYNFSANISDAVAGLDGVIFGFNGANYTPFSSGSNYFYNITGLSSGRYNYSWYVNDSVGNVNSTFDWYYVRNGTANGTFTVTQNYLANTVSIGFANNTAGDSDVNYTLYRDGVFLTSSLPFTESPTAGAYYTYVFNSTGGQNYTSGTIASETVLINYSPLISGGGGAVAYTTSTIQGTTTTIPIIVSAPFDWFAWIHQLTQNIVDWIRHLFGI